MTPTRLLLASGLLLALALPTACQSEAAAPLPEGSPLERIVLAGGCFWCTELVFERLEGVEAVVSGYAGGSAGTASYAAVSAGRTEHAEAIQVTYDPQRITREQLFDVFFEVAHDPTQLDRQGPDHGHQYRSAVFYADEEERRSARAHIDALEAAETYDEPLATTLEPLEAFYPAEEDHQDFVQRNPDHGYVVRYAWPKVEKLKKRFPELVREEPHTEDGGAASR